MLSSNCRDSPISRRRFKVAYVLVSFTLVSLLKTVLQQSMNEPITQDTVKNVLKLYIIRAHLRFFTILLIAFHPTPSMCSYCIVADANEMCSKQKRSNIRGFTEINF